MPISVVCPACQKKLKAPDNAAGKRTKCPGCQGVLEIPASETAAPKARAPAAPSAATRQTDATWEVHTAAGETYGPITKTELDKWVNEGRVDGQCQLLVKNGTQWQWASEVYPQLAAGAAAPAFQGGPAIQTTRPVPAMQTSPPNPFSNDPATSNPYAVGSAGTAPRASVDAGIHPGAITISILSFVLAALNLFCGVGWAVLGEWLSRVFFAFAAWSEAAGGGDATGLRLSGALIVVYGVSCMLHGVLLIVAGIGLLVRAQWGRIMAICLGAFSLILCLPYILLLQYSVIWSLMMLLIYVGYGAATIAVLLTSGVARTYRKPRR